MNYESRLICFIDALGFKSAIEQSMREKEVLDGLYKVIHNLKSSEILNFVYGNIPLFFLDKDNTVKPVREVIDGDLIEKYSEHYPVTITQFSDSFVLSCPSENQASCELLLKSLYLIHLMFYHNLGMMIRGGISIGELIHEDGGALFGPAMNEAYHLESKKAIYPRVVISSSANVHLAAKLHGKSILHPIIKSEDGLAIIDLISIFSWPHCAHFEDEDHEDRLSKIEQDVLKNFADAHPKISYLIDRWASYKSQRNKSN